MKILKLFAGIGGDRTYYRIFESNLSILNEITAVEINPNIANIYLRRFPNDTVFIEDAYEFLVKNYIYFDCITVSPPCITHSQCNNFRKAKILPDMRLYSIIVFLMEHFKGPWYVENVKPSYFRQIKKWFIIQPTIQYGRHLIWSNMKLEQKIFLKNYSKNYKKLTIPELCLLHQIDPNLLDEQKKICRVEKRPLSYNTRQILRNCLDYRIGLHLYYEMEKYYLLTVKK